MSAPVDVLGFLAREARRANPEHSQAAEDAYDAVAELIAAAEAFQRKFWEVAERHNDRTCDHDVCHEVRAFRAALARVGGAA